jgi:hypothetical protein
MSVGAIDQLGSLIYFPLLYFTLKYVYDHFRIIEINNVFLMWFLAYIAVDFISYWYHRISHRVNYFWAGHITHHSSEQFNFSNGFRTSLFQGINRIPFWSILPIFGFPPEVLILTLKISGLYDFLQHNEYVPKYKYIEKIIITPSLHRVHHGRNEKYIDKNYGSTFSIWDRMFGTFQEETEKVEYGIKGNYQDNNPILAIGYHYKYLFKRFVEIPKWQDKLFLFIMPPEWKIDTSYNNQSNIYLLNVSKYHRMYGIFQILINTIGITILLIFKDFITLPEFIVCSLIGIIQMSKGVLIINNNMYKNFEINELINLIFGIIFTIISKILYSNYLFYLILIYLVISLILILFVSRNTKINKSI